MKSKKIIFLQAVLMFLLILTHILFSENLVQAPVVLAKNTFTKKNIFIAENKNTILLLRPNLLSFYAKIVVLDSNNGSIGPNRNGYMSVGSQRYSTNLIAYGLVTKNVDLIETGIRTIEYAFTYQNDNGSFPDYSPGNFGGANPSSVAFFYHDLGQSLLLCKESKWFQRSKETAKLRVRLNKLLIPTSTSLTWLIEQKQLLLKGDGNGRATNRLFIDALAFYLAGKYLNRSDAVMLGEYYAKLALQQQTKEGFFLEKRASDSSYQAVSLFKALVLYSNLEPSAISLKLSLWQGIEKGIAWQLSHILTTGEVSTAENSRVYPGGETYLGKEKHIDYVAVIMALNYYSHLSDNHFVQNIADQVFRYYRKKSI
ncbi:MAG: hypothetical protein V7L21_22475 [Nostoc sp.]|uniref:hypothetical protein n=1 Tax=Nostoc sp. TaxID=1180 RepID=UPI002FF8983F